jgi:transglutaminase-like putative cysteine protease
MSANGAVQYRIRHHTEYAYGAEVVHSHQLLHLRPRPSDYQHCIAHALRIEPFATAQSDHYDAFGNPITRIEIDRPHSNLHVTAEMEMDVSAPPECKAEDSLPWETVRARLMYSARPPVADVLDASRFRHESQYVRIKRVFETYSADCFAKAQPVLACVEALMHKLFKEMKYSPGETHIATPLLDVLRTKRGVCQDYAHLMIACLRSRGLAAQYVSGYLRTTPAKDQPQLVGSDASHAWVAVYAPPLGWIELDPTNDVRVRDYHIALAWGRDFADVSPLRGVIVGGGHHEVRVSVDVRQISPPTPTAAVS